MNDDLRDRVLALIQYMRSTYRTGVAADDVAALVAEVERVSADAKSANAQAYRNFCDLQEVSADRDVWMRRATVAEADADRLFIRVKYRRIFAGDNTDDIVFHDEALAVRRD